MVRHRGAPERYWTPTSVRLFGVLPSVKVIRFQKDKAPPFIVNFEMVDTSKDGKISQEEFNEGCAKGLVQEQASKPAESGGGQTPEQPTKE